MNNTNEWKCSECGVLQGRHDMWFENDECGICHTRKESENLRSKVIEQIERDIASSDYTAIYELLEFVPEENLKGFLSHHI